MRVPSSEISNLSFPFVFLETDSRRATFKVGTTTFPAKLVDLPCLIESHKTLDTKHMFKIADISQMLLVEPNDPTTEDSSNNPNSEATTNGKEKKKEGFNIEDFVYPHGITPPMKWVRKRRFRKRAHKRVSFRGDGFVSSLYFRFMRKLGLSKLRI